MRQLRPFWRYYGGKWLAALKYPPPAYDTIVEPFAGAAGYSLRYFQRKVVLVERYEIVAGIWHYLIHVKSSEIRRIPSVDNVNDLPSWVPEPARHLVGFYMNEGTVSPKVSLSSGAKKLRASGRTCVGWYEEAKNRIAEQVDHIRHWRVIHGDYTKSPNIEATWFVDPPYSSKAGSAYVYNQLDRDSLGDWCLERDGQLIVCESLGADWLPFQPLMKMKPGPNNRIGGSQEAVLILG